MYYLFRIKAWFVSLMPFSVLYIISDLLSFFLRKLARYRKEVIMSNLGRAFPDKSHEELKMVAKRYYRNLSDVMLEVIKLEQVSAPDLLKRFEFENFKLFEETLDKGQSIIIAIGHCGNWEWMGTALGLMTGHKGYAVVKPLSDKRFNRYMEMLRHRLNADSTIPFKDTFRVMLRNSKQLPTFNVFAADQTPTREEINYWSSFLGQDTPFFLGIERIAKALGFAVIFIEIQRNGRGRYKGVMKLITDDPKNTEEFYISNAYIEFLEKAIRNNPDNWLWSHKRWKHKREA